MKLFGNSFEDFKYEGSKVETEFVHLILKLDSDSANTFQMKKVETVSVVCKDKCEQLSVNLLRLTSPSDLTSKSASALLSASEMVGTCTRSALSGNSASGGDFDCTISDNGGANYVVLRKKDKFELLNLAVYAGYDCYRRKFRIEHDGTDVSEETF